MMNKREEAHAKDAKVAKSAKKNFFFASLPLRAFA
jgi:hypothetical protein